MRWSVGPLVTLELKTRKTRTLFIFSRVLRDSTPRYVGRSVGRPPFYFFVVFERTAPAQTLVTFSSTAPAHPHSTRVAVYPALFFLSSPYGLIYISYILFLSVTFYSSAFLYLLLCLFLPFYFVFLPLFYFFTIFEKKIFYKLCCIRKFTIHIVSIG